MRRLKMKVLHKDSYHICNMMGFEDKAALINFPHSLQLEEAWSWKKTLFFQVTSAIYWKTKSFWRKGNVCRLKLQAAEICLLIVPRQQGNPEWHSNWGQWLISVFQLDKLGINRGIICPLSHPVTTWKSGKFVPSWRSNCQNGLVLLPPPLEWLAVLQLPALRTGRLHDAFLVCGLTQLQEGVLQSLQDTDEVQT